MTRIALLVLAAVVSGCSTARSVDLQNSDKPFLLITQDEGYNCLGIRCPYPSKVFAILWHDGWIVRANSAKGSTRASYGQVSPASLAEIRAWVIENDLRNKSPEFTWAEHEPTRSVTLWVEDQQYDFIHFFLDHPDPLLEELFSVLEKVEILGTEPISGKVTLPRDWFSEPSPN